MHGNHFVPQFMSIHIFAIFRPYTLCAINFPGETLNINLLLCPFFLALRRFLHLVFGVCVVHESQTWMLAVHEWQRNRCTTERKQIFSTDQEKKEVEREIETYKVNIIFACCACMSRQMISHVFFRLLVLLLLVGDVTRVSLSVCGRINPSKNRHALSDFKTSQIHSKTIYPIWHRHPTFDARFFICTPTQTHSLTNGWWFFSTHSRRHFIAIDVNAFYLHVCTHTFTVAHSIPGKILY